MVCITESWLNPSISNSALTGDLNYSVFRKDRDDSYGGVCIMINEELLKAVPVALPTKYSNLELVVIDIINLQSKCRVFVCYRPPSSDSDSSAVQYSLDMCECIESLYPNNSTVIVCGDFNLPNINWTNIDVSAINNPTCSGIFLSLFLKYAFNQYVSEPTRHNCSRNTSSTLDLVLCNDYNFVYNTTVSTPFSTSDHCIVSFNIVNSINTSSIFSKSYDFKRADWAGITLFLNNIDFAYQFEQCCDVAGEFDCFYNILNECISSNVPVVKTTRKNNYISYPSYIRRRLNRKSKAWKLYKHFGTKESLLTYKKLTSECRSLIHKYTLHRERKVVNSANLSAFYRHCNRRFNCRSVIGPIRSPDGSLTSDSASKADIFQDSFSRCYTIDNNITPVIDPARLTNTRFTSVLFGPSLVNKAIKKLRPKAKGGPDGIPPEFIKNCSLWLSVPLSYLFQQSFDAGYMPQLWLNSYVTPVFKKGDPTDPNNYRPIALTCVLCKLMESIIKDQLLSYLLSHNLISKHQHAFIAKHSTSSNLLECVSDWSIALNNRQCVDVIYVDYKRAFDSIVHNKLLNKLSIFGIAGKLLNWLSAFLHNRTQRVAVENCLSVESCVVSGVIQGSVLGPILFLLFINDIEYACNSSVKLKLFADDLKIYSVLNMDALNNTNDVNYKNDLQLAIDNISNWSNEWQLTINVDKCSVLGLYNGRSCVSKCYVINGAILSVSTSINDLGICIDNKLSYNSHISNIVVKAMQRVGLLFRSFLCRDLLFLRKAYITYIRPLLEYNSIIWSPCLKKHIDLLERVQRRFSKRIPSLRSKPYLERLACLDIQPLEVRRLHFDLIYYYKIIHNLTPHNPNNLFSFHNPPSSSRNSASFIQKPTKGSKTFFSSFCNRSVDCWNSLPQETRSLNSLCSFKSALHSLDLSSFLYGNVFTHLASFGISNILGL